ncbi:MAG: class I SAM-dependent methyltransferase, partial [Bacteroidota bacterium]
MDFAKAYHALRTKEGRMYTDDVLAKLPNVPQDHALYREWMARKDSLVQLMNYLFAQGRPLRILDLGCGNGWFSRHLANLPGAEVLGVDVGAEELAQAERVFGKVKNLRFAEADIFSSAFQ